MKKIPFFIGLIYALIFGSAQAQTLVAPATIDLYVQAANDSNTTADTTALSLVYPLVNMQQGTLISITDSVHYTFSFSIPDTTLVDSIVTCIGLPGLPNHKFGAAIPLNPAQGSSQNATYTRIGSQVQVEVGAMEFGEYIYEVKLIGNGTSSPVTAPTQLQFINL